jgi:hypothetical protein
VQATCCSTVCDGAATWCGVKMHRHYPGGQIDHWQGWTPPLGGGWVTEFNCAIVGGPYTERAQRRANTATPYARGCYSRPSLIGVGGMSATTCGGSCCYGGEGGPNAIRITYK